MKQDLNSLGNVYQITNYNDGAILEEESTGSVANTDGIRSHLQYKNTSAPNQFWRIEPQTNFSYTIHSCQTEGSVLADSQVTSLMMLGYTFRTVSLIDNILSAKQIWNFAPISPPVTAGVYRLRFANGSNFSASTVQMTNDQSLASVISIIRVDQRWDGTYTVEIMTSSGLYYLGCNGLSSAFLSQRLRDDTLWKILRTGDETPGYNIVHMQSNLALTMAASTAVDVLDNRGDPIMNVNLGIAFRPRVSGSAEQTLTLETPSPEVPSVSSLDSIPSSQIPAGIYRIKTTRGTSVILKDLINVRKPDIPLSRHQVVAGTPLPDQTHSTDWMVQSTANGFYTFSCRNLLLAQASSITERSVWPYAPLWPGSATSNFDLSSDTWSAGDIIGAAPSYDATQ